jgi:predicted nucleotidyltransferase
VVWFVLLLHHHSYFSLQGMGTATRKAYDEVAGVVAEVDLNGWECRHAFTQLWQSNMTMMEAFTSPLLHVTPPFFFF